MMPREGSGEPLHAEASESAPGLSRDMRPYGRDARTARLRFRLGRGAGWGGSLVGFDLRP